MAALDRLPIILRNWGGGAIKQGYWGFLNTPPQPHKKPLSKLTGLRAVVGSKFGSKRILHIKKLGYPIQ